MGLLLPSRFTQRTICTRVLPLEYQYVMSQKRDGFEYKTLQTYQFEQAQKPQKRMPENPIHIARMYLREREGDRPKTYEEIAKKFGVSKAEVCYHIALVNRLPGEFVAWLERQDEPEILRILTERRLRPIARLSSQTEQWKYLSQFYRDQCTGYLRKGNNI
jgi:AraC-like DNA-binding protein